MNGITVTMGISTHISFEKDDLIKSLEGALSAHPHNKVLAKSIVNNLDKSQVGIEHLVKALLGIEIKTDLKVDDVVSVPYQYLPTWRIDKDLTHKAGLIFQDRMEATILEIDLYSIEPLKIEYEYINNAGEKLKDTYIIRLNDVYLSDKNDISLSDE